MSDKEILQTKESPEKTLDQSVIEAGKEKGNQLKKGVSENNINSMNKAGAEIAKDIESTQKIDDLAKKITENPELEDPKNSNIVQNFTESLKSGNISEAIKTLFDFLKGVMGPGSNPESTFWFKDNKEIQEFLTRLSQNIDKLSLSDLENQKEKFLNKIESTSGVKKKLGLTYALSRLLDEIVYKKEPSKSWMKGGSSENNNKSANELAIARMAQTVKPGDVLTINKSEQSRDDKLLTQLASDDLDSSHVLIVTDVDPNTGKVTVAHSTGGKFESSTGRSDKNNGSGVQTNLDFTQYANQFNALAIASLRPPEGISETLVKNVLQKDGKAYDNKAAASTALTGKNFTASNDKYNCVELIAQSFPPSISETWKDWTHPSQMLQEMKPSYVTIAGKSIGGS